MVPGVRSIHGIIRLLKIKLLMNPNNSSVPEVQSFVPYTGKAPIIIQIVGGLMWLAAAGLIITAVVFFGNLLFSAIYLVVAIFFIITARSLFKMKKIAFTYCVILGSLLLILSIYSVVVAPAPAQFTNLIIPVLILLVAFMYKNKFVN